MISCSLIAGLSWFSLSEIIGERLGKIAVAVFEFFSQKHSARLGKEAREKREKEVKRTSYLLKVRADEAAMRTEIRWENLRPRIKLHRRHRPVKAPSNCRCRN